VALEPLPTAELAGAAGFPIAMDARIRPVWRGARLAGPRVHGANAAGRVPGHRRGVYGDTDGVVVVPYGVHDEVISRAKRSGSQTGVRHPRRSRTS
jgi:regulator of RNase E activity RraA